MAPTLGNQQGSYLTSAYQVQVTYGNPRAGIIQNTGADWFGPLNPISPVAPPEIASRQFDYAPGYNLAVTPRNYESISFATLRGLADGYDLLRLVIETRKDQVARMQWAIKPRDPKAKHQNNQATKIEQFFKKPDGIHGFQDWIRLILEDLFVIDAATIYMHRDKGGKLIALMPLDGATIKPVIDDWGRTPQPIAMGAQILYPVAYQQVLKGFPAVDYSVRDLTYRPRNIRLNRTYGYSPVEQIITTVNTALRRQLFTLSYFTEGNIPDSLVGVPESWTPDQIATYQKYWDGYFGGELGRRRGAKFVPGGVAKTFVQTKEPDLKNEFDEWLARVVCFAFSISPQAFIKQINRACYSVDTEVLTECGWLRIDNVKAFHRIATFNSNRESIEYHKPVQRHVYDVVDCEMVAFKTKAVDVLVTPEHDVWLTKDNWAGYKKLHADETPAGQFYFRASAVYTDGPDIDQFVLPEVEAIRPQDFFPPMSIKMDDWLEFLGCAIAQGGLSSKPGHHMMTISQRFGSRADMIDNLLERLPFNSSKYPDSDENCARWNVFGKQVCKWLHANIGSYCNEKHIPREFLNLSTRQLSILFEALMETDGSWDCRGSRASGSYSSVSKQLADDVQELAFKLGYSTSVALVYEANGAKQALWVVNVCNRERYALRGAATNRTPASVSRELYTGRVFCFEVPNGLFITRRNGKIGIHGNSADTQKQIAEEEGLVPILAWAKALIDDIIEIEFDSPDLEFAWGEDEATDETAQETILTGYASAGIMRINEARGKLGLDPDPSPAANQLMVLTGTGYVPVNANTIEGKQANIEAFGPSPALGGGLGSTHEDGDDNEPSGKPNDGGQSRIDGSKPGVLALPAPKEGEDAAKAFNPDQARDDDGRWTAGSGSDHSNSSSDHAASHTEMSSAALAQHNIKQVVKGVALVAAGALAVALAPEIAGAAGAGATAVATIEAAAAVAETVGEKMFIEAGIESVKHVADHLGFDTSDVEHIIHQFTDVFKAAGPSKVLFAEVQNSACDAADAALTELLSRLKSEYADAPAAKMTAVVERLKETCAKYKNAIKALAPIGKRAGVGKAADAPFSKSNTIIGPFGVANHSSSIKRLKSVMKNALSEVSVQVAKAVGAELEKLGKANEPDDDDDQAERIADNLRITAFDSYQQHIEDEIASAALATTDEFSAAISLGDVVDQVNDLAVAYAGQRSATMITQISDSTRNMVRITIANGLADNIGRDEIIQNLTDSYAFSDDRAELIATYEIGTANCAASLISANGAAKVGVDVLKGWLTADDDRVDEEICRANEAQGYIALDDNFQSGDQHPLGHPRCRCVLTYKINKSSDTDDEDEGDE